MYKNSAVYDGADITTFFSCSTLSIIIIRMAGEVDLKLKTGDSENMNNPVNETRLKEMYKELRMDWTKMKPKMKQVAQSDPEQIKAGILVHYTV